MKSANYRRVSLDEQITGTSLENQKTKLGVFCGGDAEILDYCDAGCSGKDDRRPDLQRLLTDAKLRRFDRVVCTTLDRLARNLRLLLELEEELWKYGIYLVFVDQGVDTSKPMGKFIFQILGIIAEWERETIIERTKSGRYARYQEGKWGPGQPLYGYAYNRETQKLEIREDEAAVVKRIYNLYVFDRLGMEQIARLLNIDHVKPRQQGKLWHKTAVRDILIHPAYKGEHPNGVETPTIIGIWLWESAQKRRRENPHLHRREGLRWLLQGMVHCGICGRILSCSYSHGTKGRRVYSCPGRRLETKAADEQRCRLPILDAEWLEHEVYDHFIDAMSDPEAMSKTLRNAISSLTVRKTQLEEAIEPIDNKLAEVREKLERLAEDWVVKRLDPEKANLMRHELEAEEVRLVDVKQNLDPEQLAELEDVSWRLELYHGQLKCIARGDTEGFPFLIMDLPETKTEVERQTITNRACLDYVQAELWAYLDRTEIKALIPITSLESQELEPDCR
jgi:site-specific DNA recombinase